MGTRNGMQLSRRFRKRYIQSALLVLTAFQEKLQRQGRFARSGITFDQIQVICRQAAVENLIQTPNASRNAFFRFSQSSLLHKRGARPFRIREVQISVCTSFCPVLPRQQGYRAQTNVDARSSRAALTAR